MTISTVAHSHGNEPIAIIGSGCRFPGASNTPSKLWELLREPRDLLTTIPESRFNPTSFYHPDRLHHGTSNVRHSYLLSEDHRYFDAQFFAIKPTEANSIDPQQRLLLETVYESVESAGLSIAGLQGSNTAVYVGLMTGDYADLLNRDSNAFPTYFATGTARSILSNRVSYFFDWHGPSMTIDTACSSSLVALHQAAQVLRAGDCKVAVAAGSNLILGPEQYIAESKLKMLSPSGRSRMWDRDADGYARGDGIASVVLKTLRQAIADGDHIECIVRETGLNQDGRTKGITMPSPTAQASLIQSTYTKANLDLNKASDRPQFFEAHGTGTPAGDPIEAEAISKAFFGGQRDQHQTLYVGSIKTVIGHTEGTAGLAAVLKASLALQHGVIPPNLLFNNLNPAIEPFYEKLEVPRAPQSWPNTNGGPRRVSVNSFGFGGANAHAILERYEPVDAALQNTSASTSAVFTPFTFSAVNERSLAATLEAYSSYLRGGNGVAANLGDLSWTLNSRRSILPSRIAFSAASSEALADRIDAALDGARSNSSKLLDEPRARPSTNTKPAILGIFTGQGAQWAGMGRELILASDYARKFIGRLEERLARLQPAVRPSWSLMKELLADASTSRLSEAALSQPLCTAIQVLLVELLRSAGINFKAVVGHSSGEIAAAYAAGVIATPEDAICIAYYRGFHSKLASGPNGEKGAMLAVGTSLEDAKELCELPHFEGRLRVAASNSPASVTLSGDEDAIKQAIDVFEEEKKFARLVRVDKAYHSHHMLRCSEAYVKSITESGIQPMRPQNSNCSWFSSVSVQEMRNTDGLSLTYWNDNMVNPVYFSQAIELAISKKGPFDIAIEVGPHPALQGPAKQTIEAIFGDVIPYTGMLRRASNDVEAFSDGLAYIWKSFGESVIDFASYDALVSGGAKRKLLKNLPTYSWDHDRIFWHESRLSKAYRARHDPIHELLGTRSVDGAENQIRWRNVLRPKEMPWLAGHRIQGQMVFPGAGYVSAALEAVMAIAGPENIRLLELDDVVIGQAIAFNDEDSSVETLFTLTNVTRRGEVVSADFFFYSATVSDSDLTLNCSGRVRYELGESSKNVLPPRPPETFNLIDVNAEQFYSSLSEVGYQYSGSFRALSSLKRKLGTATGLISKEASVPSDSALLVHPATLDAAIQSIILAFCWPGDGRLWSIHVPTNIRRIRVNPSLWLSSVNQEELLQLDATVAGNKRAAIDGDVDIFTVDGQYTMLQLEGMRARPFAEATSANDFHLFSELVWDTAAPDGEAVAWDGKATTDDYELAYTLERVAYFYLRHLNDSISDDRRESFQAHHTSLFEFVDHVLSTVASGKHQYIKKQWEFDTHDQILKLVNSHPDSIDLRIMHAVGENLAAVVRNETTILQYMLQDNMLNDYYVNALGFHEYTKYLARMVGQIAHRYPHMNILEIGAGTGGATKSIFKELGQTFAKYVFTDISSGFFEHAQEAFQSFSSKMSFKTLNIEKDPALQGFEDHSFDLIIASLVLHATARLEETLENVRRLLKPGGYLVMLEITNNGQARLGFVFGGLPGWWLGRDDGRTLSPCISAPEWDAILRRTGFAGIEAITPDLDPLPYPLSVIATQAVDDRIDFLRRPLVSPLPDFYIPQLTILGGVTSNSLQLLGKIIGLLRNSVANITRIDSLDFVAHANIPQQGTILSLVDLDEPIFQSISDEKLEALKQLFERSKSVLWITRGARNENPLSSMTIGLGRTLLLELPHLRLQFLDLGTKSKKDAHTITEALLRFVAQSTWQQNEGEIGLLWSNEPELALDNGRYLVPRLRLEQSRNARYNSAKRPITKKGPAEESILTVSFEKASHIVRELPSWTSAGRGNDRDHAYLEIAYSSLQAIKILEGKHLFLLSGYNVKGESFLTLSPHLESKIEVHKDQLVQLPASLDEADLLWRLAHHLLARTILAGHTAGGMIVVLDPSDYFSIILSQLAARADVTLTFLTSGADTKGSPWVFIHPQAPSRTIKALLPPRTTSFVNFSMNDNLVDRIIDNLPPYTKVESLKTLLSSTSHTTAISPVQPVLEFLAEALRNVRSESLTKSAPDLYVSPLSDLSTGLSAKLGLQLIDWRESKGVSIQVEPVDSKPLFAKDKTYWLVGLTGGLGQSLCSWMVHHGARYVVLSSRNPKVDDRWLESLEALGARIRIFSNDITDRNSVRQVYEEISNSLPPLGGVAQGAMVLHDSLFVDINMEKVNKVLRPKVDGSQYLQDILGDTVLDFFVFFSSIASVTGNGGQSHYAAANMFMAGLAAQRRKRGLAASVIHIGAIIGNGYITRELTQAQQNALRSYGNVLMSEQDFHQIFAEAVVSSNPSPKHHYEIMTGLRLIDADGGDRTTWFDNPKFQHLIFHREGVDAGNSTTNTSAPIKVQLLGANTQQQVAEILRTSLINKLKAVLQMTSEEAQQRFSSLDSSADELGIDSLIAVEIRTWFLKELNVDMPVLKILGGDSIGDLLAHALEKLPTTLIPNVSEQINATAAVVQIRKLQIDDDHFDESHTADTSPSPDTSNNIAQNTFEQHKPELIINHPSYEERPLTADLLSTTSSQGTGSVIDKQDSSIGSWESVSETDLDINPSKRTLRMSFGQSRFWFLRQYLADQTTFNITCSIRLMGKLRIQELEKAVKQVGLRHGALRTAFFLDKDQQPKQSILTTSTLHLEQEEIESESEISLEFQRMKEHVFDLERGELMRIRLLSLSPTSHNIIIGYHHINMDGISLEILLTDLQKAYEGNPMNDSVLQYDEFTLRQHREYEAGKFNAELAFWRKEFSEFPPPLPLLPLSRKKARQPLTKYEFHRVDFRLHEELARRIEGTARRLKGTPFHFYLATFKTLLFRHLDIDDLAVGIADGNRNDSDTLASIGFYLNLLPLRFRSSKKETFVDALKDAKKKTYSALANARVPFDVLLSELSVPRSATYSPLFQVFLNYRQGVEEKRPFCGCETDGLQFESGRTAYDINVDIVDNVGGNPLIAFNVQCGIYTAADAAILLKNFVNLLEAFSRDPVQDVRKPSLYDQDEVQQAINLGRSSVMKSQWAETLSHQVDRIVGLHSNQLAIRDSFGNKWSYKQLAQKVDSIAAALLDTGTTSGSIVAVFQEPTSDWAASLLAILRIGAIYIPLDLRTPHVRLATIVKDCRPEAILVHEPTVSLALDLQAGPTTRILNVSSLPASTSKKIKNSSRPDSVALLMYTSGSTGIPKGIKITNAGLVNQIEVASRVFGIDVETVLQQGAFSFDISIWQTFFAIANGGQLVIASKTARGDSNAIVDLILSEGISLVAATPSELISWLRTDSSKRLQVSNWRTAIAGGEQFTEPLLHSLRELGKTDLRLFNAYGPTEISVASNAMELKYWFDEHDGDVEEQVIPVGYTLPNYYVFIVDNELQPVAAGVPGEIVIGGAGVSLGYFNNDALTKERFIRDRFSPADFNSLGWTSVHRTGDRGRLRGDGALIVEGRIDGDTQIKLRGIRIDLRDIEATIIKSAAGILQDAIVSLRSFNPGGPEFLVAHVVFAPNSNPDNRERFLEKLRKDLQLPQSMVPAVFISLENLPLTTSGKVSRRSISTLPLPQREQDARSTELTDAEIRMKKIWEEVLSPDTAAQFVIEAGTDFFHVGGNSLLLVQLQKHIKNRTGVNIPLVTLFDSSLLGSMAAKTEDHSKRSKVASRIDWEQETQLAPDFVAFARNKNSIKHPIGNVRIVILTGATGFLGQAVLRQLLEDRNVEKVHCVAVRSLQGRRSLLSSSKVEVYEGDLSLPRLGLAGSTADRIFGEADAIIHNGADVSFLKSYESLKRPNVDSTKELIKFSLKYQIPFHYVSTGGVGQLSGQDAFEETSMREHPPPVHGLAGYISSKWVSEQILEKVNKTFGLAVWIHRPSNITGEGAPELDIMSNLLKFSRLTRTVPKFKAVQGYLNFVPVEDVANDLVREVLNHDSQRSKSLVHLHHSGQLEIPIAKMRRYLEAESGRKFRSRSLAEWIEEARAAGLNEMVAAYLGSLESGESPVVLPRFIR